MLITETGIKVHIKTSGEVAGVDADNEQQLREASWQHNDLLVDVIAEYRQAKIRLLGGRWTEAFA